MTDRLSIYNNALIMLDSRRLSSLSENRKSRRVLDAIWNSGFLARILETGQFNSATRTFQSTYDNSIEPSFGFNYGHKKPDDWVRTLAISNDEYLSGSINTYTDEDGYWWSDEQYLYIQITSSAPEYGGDLGRMPQSLLKYAETELAHRACKTITGSDNLSRELAELSYKAKRSAQGIDAMNQPVKYAPNSSWVSSRRSSGRRNYNSVGD